MWWELSPRLSWEGSLALRTTHRDLHAEKQTDKHNSRQYGTGDRISDRRQSTGIYLAWPCRQATSTALSSPAEKEGSAPENGWPSAA